MGWESRIDLCASDSVDVVQRSKSFVLDENRCHGNVANRCRPLCSASPGRLTGNRRSTTPPPPARAQIAASHLGYTLPAAQFAW